MSPDPDLVITGARVVHEDDTTLTLGIGLANNTAGPLHVWADPRRIEINGNTLRLVLAQADPEPVEGVADILSVHPRVPAQAVIQPGAATLKVAVPKTLHRIDLGTPGLGGLVADSPLGTVERLDVEIAYAETPFHPEPTDQPGLFIRRLQEHGTTISATVQVEAPEEEG